MTRITSIVLYTYRKLGERINLVDWSFDGKWIVCGTAKGHILVVEASGKERATYQIGKTYFWALAWFPDNQLLLVCFGNTIMMCNAWSGEQRLLYYHGIAEENGLFSDGQRSLDGLLIASTAYEEEIPTVQIHDVRTGHFIATFRPREFFDEFQSEHAQAGLPVDHPPFCPIGWSPKGRYIALGQNYKVHIWEPTTDQRVFLHSVASRIHSLERIEAFAWSPDERCLVFAREERLTDTALANHTIEVWDWVAGERWSTYRGHTNVIRYIQWLAGKDQIVSVSTNEIHLWDAHTGTCIARSVLPIVDEKQCTISGAVLSPDRSQLALVGSRYLPDDKQEGLLWVWRHGLDLS